MQTQKERPLLIVERAYYTGTEVLAEGYCLCYDADKGTATDEDVKRAYNVEKPTIANCKNFAGWVHPSSVTGLAGPCHIDIIKPGSEMFRAFVGLNSVVNETRLTVQADQWYMGRAGFPGAGSATAMETDATLTATPAVVMVQADDGPQSGGVQSIEPPTTGATFTVMVGGVTYLTGTVNIGTGDHVGTLADGLYPQQDKAILCLGTFTAGNEVDVNITHHETSDPEHRFYDAAGDQDILVWNGFEWAPKVTPTSADAAT